MFGAGCLVLAHMPGPSIKGFHKREGEGGAHEGKKQSMCSKTKGMELVHNLGVPSLTWYENQLQTGRSHFQLVWNSITNCAFPLSAGMEIVHNLGVPTSTYGKRIQTGRSLFQLVWKSSTNCAYPLSAGMKIVHNLGVPTFTLEIHYELGVPTFSWYGNHLQTVRSHFHMVWKLFTVWAFSFSLGMEINYKVGVPTFSWYEN